MTADEVEAKPGRLALVNIYLGVGKVIEKAPQANCGSCGAHLGGVVVSVDGVLKWAFPESHDGGKLLLILAWNRSLKVRRPRLAELPIRGTCRRCKTPNVVLAAAFNSVVLSSVESPAGRASREPGTA